MSFIEKIGIVNVLNSILVNENVRPAMLVQPVDYNELTGKDPKTKIIIEEIKEMFPELLLSEDYESYQGVIISKTNYNNSYISEKRMGKILGYPYYKDFNSINHENVFYSIDFYVKEINGRKIQLFANICKDEINTEQFKSFIDQAKIAFGKEKYKDILNGFEIYEVGTKINKIVPTQSIIQKIIENKELEQDELNKIQNILFNFGFSTEIQIYFLDHFQYHNPIHKGILLDLLIKEKNDILSPFYPLQYYPDQEKNVYEITKKLEKDTIDILEKTKK
jgi:hypothetical protein